MLSGIRFWRMEANGNVRRVPSEQPHIVLLPPELQLQILGHLPVNSIVRLQQTCKYMNELVKVNEVYLCIKLLHAPTLRPTLAVLYAPTIRSDTKNISLQKIAEILRFHEHASRLSLRLARQIMKEMINRNRNQRICKDMRNEIISRLAWGMTPLLLTLGHFFDSYSKAKITDKRISHDKIIQRRILEHYPHDLFLMSHQMHHLLMHLVWRRFTPTTKWWRRNPTRPSERSMINMLVFGGIEAISDLYEVRKKSKRHRAFIERAAACADRGKGLIGRRITASGEEEDDIAWETNMPKAVINLWSQPAEKLLLSQRIVQNLTEISCCGKFISSILINSLEDDKKKGIMGERNDDDETMSVKEVAAARKEVVGEQLSWSRWDGDVDHWDGWSIFGGNESEDEDDENEEDDEDEEEGAEVDPGVEELVASALACVSDLRSLVTGGGGSSESVTVGKEKEKEKGGTEGQRRGHGHVHFRPKAITIDRINEIRNSSAAV